MTVRVETRGPGVVGLTVPAQVGQGSDLMRVGRAWPSRVEHGEARLSLEGLDPAGRLRAAEVRLVPTEQPGWAVSRLTFAPPGSDPRLPDLAAVAADGEVVVHRFGRRAVVRRDDSFVKIVR